MSETVQPVSSASSRVGAKTVGVTGASGYVGGLIVDEFASRGYRVIELGRHPRADSSDFRPFVLGEPVPPGTLAGIDVLVHGAYDLTVRTRSDVWNTNVAGTRNLAERAQADGVTKILLISSMSAYEGTRQIYGQAKLACENLVGRTGGISVRLGLVYGQGGGGMIGSLGKLVRLPVVPLPGPGAHQFVVLAPQVGPAFAALATGSLLSGDVIGLAHPDPVSFRDILVSLAPPARKPRFVEVPWKPIFAAMKLAERAGLDLPLRADSMLGLVRPAPCVENVDCWATLGVSLQRLS